MTFLLLLAAGRGTRYGGNKLLADLNGAPLWTYAYRTLKAVRDTLPDTKLFVVTRYAPILDAVGEDGVDCPEGENGLSFTVKKACGCCGAAAPGDKLLFAGADMPYLSPATVKKLLSVPLADAWDSPLPLAVCASDGNENRNPVVFSGLLAGELAALTGDRGGKAVLRGREDRVTSLICPAEELNDIDTKEEMTNAAAAPPKKGN